MNQHQQDRQNAQPVIMTRAQLQALGYFVGGWHRAPNAATVASLQQIGMVENAATTRSGQRLTCAGYDAAHRAGYLAGYAAHAADLSIDRTVYQCIEKAAQITLIAQQIDDAVQRVDRALSRALAV